MTGRTSALMLVGLLVCSLAVPFGTAQTTAQTAELNVAVTDVVATPDQPAPGERFTVETTVENAAESVAFEIDSVTVEKQNGARKARLGDPGTVPAGSSITIPLTMSLGNSGSRSLRVVVEGESPSGEERELRYPVSVVVREGGPQLGLSVDDAAVGAPTPVEVTLSNGETEPIRNLDVRLTGDAFDTEGTRRIDATLESGGERRFNLSPTATAAGSHNLTAVFRFTTDSGESRVLRESRTVDVRRVRDDVTVSARVAERNGSPAVPVRIQNFGNAPLTGVVVAASDDEGLIGRESVGTVDPNRSATVTVPVDDVAGETVDVSATYAVGDRRGRATTSVAYDAVPGALDLTGVAFERDGDVFRITGSASNLGLTGVDAAIVSVQAADGVRPRGPSKEYFIGTVDASDFVSFELTADLDADTTAVPISVSYLVDGERVERTVVVERDVAASAASGAGSANGGGSNDGSGGFLVPALVTVGVLAVLTIAGFLLVRRYDDGD